MHCVLACSRIDAACGCSSMHVDVQACRACLQGRCMAAWGEGCRALQHHAARPHKHDTTLSLTVLCLLQETAT